MGILDFLTGRRPEAYRDQGDALLAQGAFGPAKLAFEKALARHKKKPSDHPAFVEAVDESIRQSCEGLAKDHLSAARELLENDCPDSAAERLTLALGLTRENDLSAEIESLLSDCRSPADSEETDVTGLSDEILTAPGSKLSVSGQEELRPSEYRETFEVLISVLPDEDQAAYRGYGDAFVKGVVDLNQGAFEAAEDAFKQALARRMGGPDHVDLELGTACLNLGKLDEARQHLEAFVPAFPGHVRGWQTLCETLWAGQWYDHCHAVLEQYTDTAAAAPEHLQLKAETWAHQGELDKAAHVYQEAVERYGSHEGLLRGLASVLERKESFQDAFRIYALLMQGCRGCGQLPDLDLHRRYAFCAAASGQEPEMVLEQLLALVTRDPDHRDTYYEKIAEVYQSVGNMEEAGRYRQAARRPEPVNPEE